MHQFADRERDNHGNVHRREVADDSDNEGSVEERLFTKKCGELQEQLTSH
jgi:hypothetical protein